MQSTLPEAFSQFIAKHHSPENPDFQCLIKNLCEVTENGSSCLSIKSDDKLSYAKCLELLNCDGADSAVGSPGSNSPIILSPNGDLFLQRYYLYEKRVFNAIDAAARNGATPSNDPIEQEIKKLFPDDNSADQAKAARCALTNRLCIITGGPGTGKTTTVVKILQLLRQFNYFSHPSDCLLLAPTGKAADRLRQSILGGLNYQKIPVEDFPTETSTIHRALGWRPNNIEFRHNAGNPLNTKVVVVDETSMVALPLMARLLDAIPEDARIILLGDKNQLSSIQVGTVLSDLISAAEQTSHPIKNCTITLKKSWRTSGSVGEACDAIRDNNAPLAWKIITKSPEGTPGSIIQADPPENLHQALEQHVKKHWLPVLLDDSMNEMEKIQGIDQFRILTPTHQGPYGVLAINKTINSILAEHGIPNASSPWYHGRSVIVQRNDYNLGIYNGDVGLTLVDTSLPHTAASSSEYSSLCVHFKRGDELKKIPPALLPECSTAWALTIHRTQGSEYDHILLIIPPHKESKILSRELLYTGLSRAKKSATIWCTEDSLHQAINTTVQRASGLTSMFSSSS